MSSARGRPWPEVVVRWSGALPAWAGFCGAVPFGFALWLPLAWIAFGERELVAVDAALCALASLLPFAIASIWVDRGEWRRVATPIGVGLLVGFCSILLCCFVGYLLLPVGIVGFFLGLGVALPCWWRGDSADLAMALLGPAPVLAILIDRSADRAIRELVPSQACPLMPFLTNDQAFLAIVLACLLACGVAIGRAIRPRLAGPKPKFADWEDRDAPD